MRRTSEYIVFINELLRRKFQREISKDIKPLDLIRKYPLIMKRYVEEIQITYKNDNKLKALKLIDGTVNLVKNENQKKLLINKLKLLKHTALKKEIKAYENNAKDTVKLLYARKMKKNITTTEKNILITSTQPPKQPLDNENKEQQPPENNKPPENLNYSLDINIKFNSEPAGELYSSLVSEMKKINDKVQYIQTTFTTETKRAEDIIKGLDYQKEICDSIIKEAQKEMKEIITLYEDGSIDPLLKQKSLLSKKAKELFELQEKYNRLKTTQLYHINNNKLEILSKCNDNAVKARQEMTELFKSFTLAIENDKRLVDYGFIQKVADNNEIIDNNEILKIVNEVKEQQELILNNNLQVKDIN